MSDFLAAVSIVGVVIALSAGLFFIAGGFLLCLGMLVADHT